MSKRERNSGKVLEEWQMDWYEQRLADAVLERISIRERLVRNAHFPVRIRPRPLGLSGPDLLGHEPEVNDNALAQLSAG